MKIIDFAKRGNVVRFYLGADDCEDYWGDDWNDRPYEHNAGTVYEEYVCGTLDVAFPFDWIVIEPQDDWRFSRNSPYSKEDFKKGNAPCIVVVPYEELDEEERDYCIYGDSYTQWASGQRAFKIFFGDSSSKIENWKYSEECMKIYTVWETKEKEDDEQ